MDFHVILDALHREIERSTGCTDPAAVALAVARATAALGLTPDIVPDRVSVTVSPNVYKNGISVGVPGTGERGMAPAAALGVFLSAHWSDGLALLDHADEGVIGAAREYRVAHPPAVGVARDAPDDLWVRAEVSAGPRTAWATIVADYSAIAEVGVNGTVLFQAPPPPSAQAGDVLTDYSMKEIVETIDRTDPSEFAFLAEAAEVNRAAANQGIGNPAMSLGPALSRQYGASSGASSAPAAGNGAEGPGRSMDLARVYTAAATEARMAGMNVPIMAITGSGNHGITNFLGILAAAETMNAPREALLRALAISSAVTVYIKGYVHRMTAFCGCAVAAGTGVAAGTAYLYRGSYDQIEAAMQSVIGSLAGMVCDGAKESCALKTSTAAVAAIQAAHMTAVLDVAVPVPMGIMAATVEESIRNLGTLNRPGMEGTDRVLLQIIESNQSA